MKTLSKSEIQFLLLKLHSLTGIIPIGLFLVFHLGFNSLRTVGVQQYQFGIDLINNMPYLLWIEVLCIHIPILFHSFMGFYVAYQGKFNVFRYAYPRNWMYTLQRVTGGVVFLFLVYHIGTTLFPKMIEGKHLFEASPFLIGIMNEQMSTWSGRLIYLVGILSATFHFANGLWGFCISWGLLIGKDAQRNAGIAFMFVGLVLALWGVATMAAFALDPVSVEPVFSKGMSL